jgi:hypothetical protein
MKYLIAIWLILGFLLKTVAIWIIWDLILAPTFQISPIGFKAALIALAWTLFTLKIEFKK